ncbi:MAG: methionyl-tRNA formyltransferase, partial [Planctomycetota bacterium]
LELVRVVTRPDRPRRRGGALAPVPVRARALELGLPCDAPASINLPEYAECLRRLEPDLAIVADYGEFISREVRSAPKIGIFNLHASLLPKYRGAAPVAHAILAGELVTGVTLFRVEARLDAGPIVDAAAIEIRPEETAGELEARLSRLAAELLGRNLEPLGRGSFREVPQDERLASFAPKLTKDAARIDWDAEPRRLADFVRALNPWPAAWSCLCAGGRRERTIFLRVRPGPPAEGPGGAPGVVAEVRKDGFRVSCRGGTVEVLEIQREGGTALDAAAYLRGRALKLGDRFAA